MRVPLFFTLFWTAITGVFLVVIGVGLVGQCRTLWFAEAVGTVDAIKMTAHRGSKGGTTYGVDVSYHYMVDGEWYESKRLRYMQWSSSRGWAAGMMERFAVGSHPTVYYNGDKPGEAALLRGPEGFDLFLAMFMTPFTLVMGMLWVMTVQGWRKTKGFMGLRVLEEGAVTRIRPSGWAAVGVGAIGVGMSAFVGIFAVGIGFQGVAPPWGAGMGWGGVLGAGAAAGLWKWVRIKSGSLDVVLDDGRAMLTAPGHEEVAYGDITGVHLKTKVVTSSKGGKTTTYEVWMHYKGADNRVGDIKLEKWTEQEAEARRFAAWLGLRVNVAVEEGV